MPIYKETQLENIASVRGGIRVDSAAALVTAAAVTKFTVTGGNVLMLGFYGKVVVDIAATACTVIVTHTPIVGAASPSILAILVGATDIQSFVAGRIAHLPAAGGVLTWPATGYGRFDLAPIYVLTPGALSITGSAAPATGTIRWSMFYVPLDPGAYVTGS